MGATCAPAARAVSAPGMRVSAGPAPTSSETGKRAREAACTVTAAAAHAHDAAPSADESARRTARAARFSEPTVSDIHAGRWRPAGDRPPTPAEQGCEGMLQPASHEAAVIAADRKPDIARLSPSRAAPLRSRSASPAAGRTARAPSLATASTALLTLAGAGGGYAVPLERDPVRFRGEFAAPLPAGHVFPRFDRVALYEHSGAFRESWAALGLRAASVCRRPTMVAPSPGCHHYKMDVGDFLAAYPYDIPFQTSHVDCGSANWASHATWPDKVASGAVLASAEELLLVSCSGDRAAAEQPPTAHSCILGSPTFKLQSCDAGGINLKNFWWWCRGVGAVPPAPSPTPLCERYNAKAHAFGTAEEVMVQRSTIEANVAAHHIATWEAHIATTPPPCGAGRKASVPCPEYAEWRLKMRHNYSVFAARYAPRESPAALLSIEETAPRFVVFCPVAPYRGGVAFLAPTDGSLFAARFDALTPLEEQAAHMARHFHAAAKPQLACCVATQPRHFVMAVPRADPLVDAAVLTEPRQLKEAAASKAEHVWCTASALADSPMYLYATLTAQRARSRREAVPFMVQHTGIWEAPRPVVRERAAFEWNHAGSAPGAAAAWEAFLRRERALGTSIQAALNAADAGDGLLIDMATSITTAADALDDLIPPAQGLPSFSAPGLDMTLVPQRPPPLITNWLVRLPPQRVPPGAEKPVSWLHVVRPWARRKICESLNKTAEHDFVAWDTGVSPGGRPKFIAIGAGGFYETPHADGSGSYNESVIIRRRRLDGLLEPLNFDAEYQDHKSLDFIKSQLGNITDRELLSFLFGGGTSWKMTQSDGSGPPHQFRIAHNLDSLPSRMHGVSNATMKLVHAGRYSVTRIRRRGAPRLCESDTACPTEYVPQWSVGIGGTDKHNSSEKRKVGDSTAPHDIVRAYEGPHGEPSGPVVVSANELTGPSKLPDDYDGPPVPFPDPEVKHRPRHVYRAAAALTAVLDSAGLLGHGWCLASTSSDVRWMFFQFFTRVAEYWLQVFYMLVLFTEEHVVELRLSGTLCAISAVAIVSRVCARERWMVSASAAPASAAPVSVIVIIRTGGATRLEAESLAAEVLAATAVLCTTLGGGAAIAGIAVTVLTLEQPELWLCAVGEKVMNMGSRPSSKIACRFNEEWTDVWRRHMDVFVSMWLRRQPKRLVDALQRRRERLGAAQARPWYAELYTDDNIKIYIDNENHELLVHGAKVETWLNREARIWMSGYAAGTIPHWCGALFVLNGGFGAVRPAKRNRAIVDATLAAHGNLDCEALERHNAFCVHLDDILDFPPGTRDGMWGPLKRPHLPTTLAAPTVASRRANEAVLVQLSSRPCASFLCAVEDATHTPPERRRMWIHISSDSCFRIEPPCVPHIFGCGPGVCWRFPLTGEWAFRHVTITEACGRALNEILLGPLFAAFELLFESDNTMALAMSQETAAADPAQYVAWRKRQEPTYAGVALRSWDVHTSGPANGLSDSGSRDRQDVLNALKASFNLHMTELDISQHSVAQSFMADVLANTPHYEPPPERSRNRGAGRTEAQSPSSTGGAKQRRKESSNEDGDGPQSTSTRPDGLTQAEVDVCALWGLAQPDTPACDATCDACRSGRRITMCAYEPPRCGAFRCTMSCGRELACSCFSTRAATPSGYVYAPAQSQCWSCDHPAPFACMTCGFAFGNCCGCVCQLEPSGTCQREVQARRLAAAQDRRASASSAPTTPTLANEEWMSYVNWTDLVGATGNSGGGGTSRDPPPDRRRSRGAGRATAEPPPATGRAKKRRTESGNDDGDGPPTVGGCTLMDGAEAATRPDDFDASIHADDLGVRGPPCSSPAWGSPSGSDGGLGGSEHSFTPAPGAIQPCDGPPTRESPEPCICYPAPGSPCRCGVAPIAPDIVAAQQCLNPAPPPPQPRRPRPQPPPPALDAAAGYERMDGAEAMVTVVHGADGGSLIVRKDFKAPRRGGAGALAHTRDKLLFEVNWLRKVHAADGNSGSGCPFAPRVLATSPTENTFTMEFISEYELEVFLHQAAIFRAGSRAQSIAICMSLLDALRALARMGLQHNDLHESNVLVREDEWQVVLIDPFNKRCKHDTSQLRKICGRALPQLKPALRSEPSVDEIERLVIAAGQDGDERRLAAMRPICLLQHWCKLNERVHAGWSNYALRACPTVPYPGYEPAPERNQSRGASRAATEPLSEAGDAKRQRTEPSNSAGDGPMVATSPHAASRPTDHPSAEATAHPLQPASPEATPGCPAPTSALPPGLASASPGEPHAQPTASGPTARALATRSPQPADAKAARARAAEEIADRLVIDDSPYALCLGDPEMARAAVASVHELKAAGVPRGTAKRDDWGFAWVARYCAASNNTVMRPRMVKPHEEMREAYFASHAIIWIAMFMLPSARRRARGFTAAMPSSSLQALYGWRSVQAECGRWLPPMKLVLDVLRGLNEMYKRRWGADALVPERTEPFPLWALREMADRLWTRNVILSINIQGYSFCNEDACACFLVLLLFGVSAAPRLDEVCSMGEGDTFFCRGNFAWFDDGREVPPTPEWLAVLLAKVAAGATTVLLKGTAAPSKADRMNIHWGGRDMWFRADNNNRLSFAFAFLLWEVHNPCPVDERKRRPAFSLNGGEVPLSAGTVRGWHKILTEVVLGKDAARTRTWHALRATLASAVAAYRDREGRPLENFEGIAQMMVRWRSIESLRLYLKVRDTTYADYVDIVTRTDGTNISADTLPPLGPSEGAADIDRAIVAIAKDVAASQPRTRGDPTIAAPPAKTPQATPRKAATPVVRSAASARSRAMAVAPAKGQMIEVDWGGEWWRGVCGVTRWSETDDAALTRVAYLAAKGHKAHSEWHNLKVEIWREVN